MAALRQINRQSKPGPWLAADLYIRHCCSFVHDRLVLYSAFWGKMDHLWISQAKAATLSFSIYLFIYSICIGYCTCSTNAAKLVDFWTPFFSYCHGHVAAPLAHSKTSEREKRERAFVELRKDTRRLRGEKTLLCLQLLFFVWRSSISDDISSSN